eukprot:TRINITY_DN1797_c1_g2_i2.p1 TRINITY_DN1797_c1_g2~~TRINITY_DN1797_c1_g2_i2.p1  ORF type:complete len:286 (-),score=65.71 TRINITY_DN1797_c1_g2_i2:186-986(-)
MKVNKIKFDKNNFPGIFITSVSSGLRHALFLSDKQIAFSMGENESGQLGIGHQNSIRSPIRIPNLEMVTHIACGARHSLVVVEEENVWAFGWGGYLQLGNDKRQDELFPRKIEKYTLSLPTKSKLKKKRKSPNDDGTMITNEKMGKIKKISASAWHSLVLFENGEVFSWGWNGDGQLGHPEVENVGIPTKIQIKSKNERVVDIACGLRHTILLFGCGLVHSFGRKHLTGRKNQQGGQVSVINNAVLVFAGGWSTFVLCDRELNTQT